MSGKNRVVWDEVDVHMVSRWDQYYCYIYT